MFSKPFIGTAPDYSRAENWLNLPERVDKAVDLIYAAYQWHLVRK